MTTTTPDTETLKRAHDWLQKALNKEREGAASSIVERFFAQAVKLENEAFGIKAA